MIHLALLFACTRTETDDESDVPADSDTSVFDTSDTGVLPDLPEALCQIEIVCPGEILGEPKAPCIASLHEGDGTLMYSGPAGVELRGRSSLHYPKLQYSLELRDYNELPTWPGAEWAYLDDGSDPGPDWAQPGFDDATWARGPAPLGFGADYLMTEVASGDTVTVWFRRAFTVENVDLVRRARVGLIRDDGAAVYVNGTEVLRDNLPAQATAGTWASSASTPAEAIAWVAADFAPGLLHAGQNTLAVEVHQALGATDDLRFDLYLEAKGDEVPTNLGHMGAEADWILNGLYADRVLFRNRLASDLFQSFGGEERYAPESVFCELQIDGEDIGLYALGERIERDDDRVDIPKSKAPGDTFIIKLDDEHGFHNNTVGVGTWQMVYPDDDEDAEDAVSDYLAAWEDAVRSEHPEDPDTGIFAYVDLDSAVDFVLLEEFLRNNDAYQLSVHLWRPPGGKLRFTPWDLDRSMGYPVGDCGAEGWLFRVEYVAAMVAVPEFHDALVLRWADLREGPLSEDAILARIDAYDETLAPGLAENLALWPVDEIVVSSDDLDQWLCPVDTYEEEHARVLAFVRDRLAWMDANIANF